MRVSIIQLHCQLMVQLLWSFTLEVIRDVRGASRCYTVLCRNDCGRSAQTSSTTALNSVELAGITKGSVNLHRKTTEDPGNVPKSSLESPHEVPQEAPQNSADTSRRFYRSHAEDPRCIFMYIIIHVSFCCML